MFGRRPERTDETHQVAKEKQAGVFVGVSAETARLLLYVGSCVPSCLRAEASEPIGPGPNLLLSASPACGFDMSLSP